MAHPGTSPVGRSQEAPPESVRLNPNEAAVLRFFVDGQMEAEEGAHWTFASIMRETGLERSMVRRACRSLWRRGLASYERALWNDDGPAGAGYASSAWGDLVMAALGAVHEGNSGMNNDQRN